MQSRAYSDIHGGNAEVLGRWEEEILPSAHSNRVGGYYDRAGNLVRHGLIREDDILPTIGGNAVAVWHRIEPLVKELRLRENAVRRAPD